MLSRSLMRNRFCLCLNSNPFRNFTLQFLSNVILSSKVTFCSGTSRERTDSFYFWDKEMRTKIY